MVKFLSKFEYRNFAYSMSSFQSYPWSLLKIFSLTPRYRMDRMFIATSRFFNSRSSADRQPAAATDFKISDDQTKKKVPVLIVGAGPVGLSLSNLLSKYGVRSMLVERRSKLSQHPQAHFINNRTMEIFRKMEGLESEIQGWEPPLDQWRKFVYCSTLSGPMFGTVDHHRAQDTSARASPTSVAHFSQHRLLRLLFKRAERLQLSVHPASDIDSEINMEGILLGHELLSFEANPDGALVRISASVGGSKTLKDVECRYLVATDGSGSTVRRLLGVGMQGEVEIQKLISVHFLSEELGQYLLINRPGMLYFVFNANVIAVIVAHNLEAGEFIAQVTAVKSHYNSSIYKLMVRVLYSGFTTVFTTEEKIVYFLVRMLPGSRSEDLGFIYTSCSAKGQRDTVEIPYHPPHKVFADFSKEVCTRIIHDVAGIPNLKMEIKSVKEWVMDAQVAEAFSSGHDRVFLAGDAAHCFPPAGGFGMNTGIQDVHNLAWKLASVLKGHAHPDLLYTYESERRLIAKANTALSVANFKAAVAIPVALGLDPSAARVAQKIVGSGVSWLPKSLQSSILGGVFTTALLQVSPLVLNKSNPYGSSRIAQVQQILQRGHSLQLQFPAEDLGFRYEFGAMLPEGTDPDESDADSLEATDATGRRHKYVPSTKPGSRLPHCLIADIGQDNHLVDMAIFSTLDLIRSDRLCFLLIVGPSRSGCHWGAAALESVKKCGMPIQVAVLWPEGSAKRLWTSVQSAHKSPPGLTEEESYMLYEWGHQNQDYVIQAEKYLNSRWELCITPESGAILVRPDDHIAWRTILQPSNTASLEVERVLESVLRQIVP